MPDPTSVAPSNSRTSEPVAAVPENVGVGSEVTSSVLDVPVSLARVEIGVDGAAGVFASIVTASAPLASETFPAVSSAVAVIE